jgi:uroporphyrinogen-III synthase
MRVLVTRPQEDAERTARRLAALGYEAVLAPVTSIVSTGEPAPLLRADALVLTSAHAVPALAQLSDVAYRPVFAVGARTAAAIREAGFKSVHAAKGDALSLAALVRQHVEPGHTLLHLAGRDRKEEPERSLLAAGYAVTVWEVYEARAAPRLPEAAAAGLAAGEIDAALHYSRRNTAILIALCEKAGLLERLRAVTHICLSEDVAAPLTASEARAFLAAEPREDSLLSALEEFRRSPRPIS